MKQLVPSAAVAGLLAVQTLLMLGVLDFKGTAVQAQESPFELPVQLIGFPVIIVAVKMSNFVKKLAYALSPSTYRRKAKRDLQAATSASGSLSSLDVLKAQEMILKEMGPDACVYEKVCSAYAEAAALAKKDRHNGKAGVDRMDWEKIISGYMETGAAKKKYYMLSVFLGDVLGSPEFCSRIVRKIKRCDVKPIYHH
ncbi:uncharacterized protein LOC132922299 [Rhopalosiphum padi]|uniref:uncharacterized protein LOC132922299 n=1 Tax=Rhopalosiphum padi TaxID=40932 RepID=UPI00298EAB95|nr:uncharacterized protein LOC132922299 [Rhopalosiphum padi]